MKALTESLIAKIQTYCIYMYTVENIRAQRVLNDL
jgi:hypothetical protein